MTDDVEVLNSTPLLWCGLALVAWGGIACCQRFVLSVSIGRLAHGPRLGLAFATWFFAIATLTQVMETASDWPHWLIALSAAIASEAVFFCYQTDTSFRTTSSGKNVIQPLLPLLRVAMIALLSVLLLEPVLTHEEEHDEEHAVAVVVDVSDSMDLRARLDNDPDRSRIQVAQQLLGGDSTTSNGLQARLERDYDVKLYELGASAREVEGKQHSQRPLRQAGSSDWTKSTDFADAMRQVRGDIPAAQLSGVLMISDGRDHSSTDINIQCQPLGNQGVPVNSVVIGIEQFIAKTLNTCAV